MHTIATTIDPAKCIGCGQCVPVCPTDAIAMRDGKAVAVGPVSIGCGHCLAACPADAIIVAGLDAESLRLRTIAWETRALAPGDFDAGALVRLMASRRSCRNYQDRPVARALLEDLVQIGAFAPSGTNSQLWTFTIVPDRPGMTLFAEAVAGFFERLNARAASPLWRTFARLFLRDALGRYYRSYYRAVRSALRQWREDGRDLLFHGAPAAILVGSRPGGSTPAEDALLATQNILLSAHAAGLGSCLIGYAVAALRREPALGRALGLAPEETIHSVIALGYPAETYERAAPRRRIVPRIAPAEECLAAAPAPAP